MRKQVLKCKKYDQRSERNAFKLMYTNEVRLWICLKQFDAIIQQNPDQLTADQDPRMLACLADQVGTVGELRWYANQ
jgi:hypothetical protein